MLDLRSWPILGHPVHKLHRRRWWQGDTYHTGAPSDIDPDRVQASLHRQLTLSHQRGSSIAQEDLLALPNRLYDSASLPRVASCSELGHNRGLDDQWALQAPKGGARQDQLGPSLRRSCSILLEHCWLLELLSTQLCQPDPFLSRGLRLHLALDDK